MAAIWKVTEADILSRGEVETIWSQLCLKSTRSRNARQSRVIFCLATFCGLRVSEICGLRVCDAKLAIPRPVLQIRQQIAKQHRRRSIPLWRLPTALNCLLDWTALRREQGANPQDYLVCAQSRSSLGKPL